MADDLRKLMTAAGALGFRYAGRTTGSHFLLVDDAGHRCVVSGTTSDWRSYANTIHEMERMSGRKLGRQKAGKLRFKKSAPMKMHQSPWERRSGAEIDALLAQAEQVRQRFRQLATKAGRRDIGEARKLLQEFEHLREVLAERHRIIDPIY